MKRAHLHAPPGKGQAYRICAVQDIAAHYGHEVRVVYAREKPLGWRVLVIRNVTGEKLSRRDIQTIYDAQDFLEAFSPHD